MRGVTIPDLHGSPVWKEIHPKDYDEIVFLGDYMDSFVYTDAQILSNVIEILEFAAKHPHVKLLVGNHDVPYLFSELEGYSCFAQGFRVGMLPTVRPIFEDAYRAGLFKLVHRNGNMLFSHAGVTNGWYQMVCEEIFNKPHRLDFLWESQSVEDKINALLDIKSHHIIANDKARGGCSDTPGPLWVHSDAMVLDALEGFHHVVGHTKMDDIWTFDCGETKVTFCDVIENKNNSKIKFFEYEI